jgi:hypothetical protein
MLEVDYGRTLLGKENGIAVALFLRKTTLIICFYKKPYT